MKEQTLLVAAFYILLGFQQKLFNNTGNKSQTFRLYTKRCHCIKYLYLVRISISVDKSVSIPCKREQHCFLYHHFSVVNIECDNSKCIPEVKPYLPTHLPLPQACCKTRTCLMNSKKGEQLPSAALLMPISAKIHPQTLNSLNSTWTIRM